MEKTEKQQKEIITVGSLMGRRSVKLRPQSLSQAFKTTFVIWQKEICLLLVIVFFGIMNFLYVGPFTFLFSILVILASLLYIYSPYIIASSGKHPGDPMVRVRSQLNTLDKTRKLEILEKEKIRKFKGTPIYDFLKMYNKSMQAFEDAVIIVVIGRHYGFYSGLNEQYLVSKMVILLKLLDEIDCIIRVSKNNYTIMNYWKQNIERNNFGHISDKSALDVVLSFVRFVQTIVVSSQERAKINTSEYDAIEVYPRINPRVYSWLEGQGQRLNKEIASERAWPTKKMLRDYDRLIRVLDEEAWRTLSDWMQQNPEPQEQLNDPIDQKIVEVCQQANERGIKPPGSRKIAKVLKRSGITLKVYSHEGIQKRIRKLRDMGLIGHPDDNKGEAKRCTPEHIGDMSEQIKEKF